MTLNCLFYATFCISARVNITMFAFVIGETTNNKHYTAQNSHLESSEANSLNKKTYLQAVSQKRQTVLASWKLPHFIENSLCAQLVLSATLRCRKQSSVKCAAYTNIWVELFWNSVCKYSLTHLF